MSTSEPSPATLLAKDAADLKAASLSETINDLDKLLAILTQARDSAIANPESGGLELAKLQNPIKETFSSMNKSLVKVSKAQKTFGKALDKYFPMKSIPSTLEPLPNRPDLVNRAITMHLLREGQFPVASQFLEEDSTSATTFVTVPSAVLPSMEPSQLQEHFREMYQILTEIKKHNLDPAMDWAMRQKALLDQRQSNFMFDLVKLKFVWLCKGPSHNGLPDDANNGILGAISYGRKVFPAFSSRHASAIHKLGATVVYLSNIADSPYNSHFDIKSGFTNITAAFTREFCSLLGLSSESPLYMAAAAGAISLPQVLKFEKILRNEKTEWSSSNELPFETPLPPSMVFHPIFVCPVMKEQTTGSNPPCLLPCGHVICRMAVERLRGRHNRFKCPYCPLDTGAEDIQEIAF